MHFLRKRTYGPKIGRQGKKYRPCTNLRKIYFTYAEAENRFNISEYQFRRGIKQLVEYGFIDIVQKGGTQFKYKTVYGLSEKWRDFQ